MAAALRLGDLPKIKDNLRTAPSRTIHALYKFIFKQEGVPNTRRKDVRGFQGFDFDEGSDAYHDIVKHATQNLLLADLISLSLVLGLDYSDTKEELVVRICNGLMDLSTLVAEDNSEADDSGDEAEDTDPHRDNQDGLSVMSSSSSAEPIFNSHFSMSFRDVQDSVRRFTGEDNYPIERWLIEFEDMAVLLGWNDLQKFIFARKSIAGLAKLFVQGETSITSWKKLKMALLEEFGRKVSSAEIHKILSRRKKKKEESLQEYLLVMKEIASRGGVEDAAVIEYVIDGIEDNAGTKAILYGAKTIKEFKQKLKDYEKMQPAKGSKMQEKFPRSNAVGSKPKQTISRCYNCGDMTHRSFECPHKNKGTKCFKCNSFGHKAPECKASTGCSN